MEDSLQSHAFHLPYGTTPATRHR